MTELGIRDKPAVRPLGDVPQGRICLRCRARFWSEGFGERICRRCKESRSWQTSVPSVRSSSRRR